MYFLNIKLIFSVLSCLIYKAYPALFEKELKDTHWTF